MFYVTQVLGGYLGRYWPYEGIFQGGGRQIEDSLSLGGERGNFQEGSTEIDEVKEFSRICKRKNLRVELAENVLAGEVIGTL